VPPHLAVLDVHETVGSPPPLHSVARSPHLDKRSLPVRHSALGSLLGIPPLLVPHLHPRGAGGLPSCRLEDAAVVWAPPAASSSRWILPAGIRRVFLFTASRNGIRLERMCDEFLAHESLARSSLAAGWGEAVLCSRLCRYRCCDAFDIFRNSDSHVIDLYFRMSALVPGAAMRLHGTRPWLTRGTLCCRHD